MIGQGLKARHIHFIALGSAIGTGLFYGSAKAIQAAGPSVLLVYLLGGIVVYFMLRALGEMAVSMPVGPLGMNPPSFHRLDTPTA